MTPYSFWDKWACTKMALYSGYSKSASWIYYNIKKLKTNVQQQISKRVWKKQQTGSKLNSFIDNIITGYLNKQVAFYTSFSFERKLHMYILHHKCFQKLFMGLGSKKNHHSPYSPNSPFLLAFNTFMCRLSKIENFKYLNSFRVM